MKDSWVIARGILIAFGVIALLVGGVKFAIELSKPDPLTEATNDMIRDVNKDLCKINPQGKGCSR